MAMFMVAKAAETSMYWLAAYYFGGGATTVVVGYTAKQLLFPDPKIKCSKCHQCNV